MHAEKEATANCTCERYQVKWKPKLLTPENKVGL